MLSKSVAIRFILKSALPASLLIWPLQMRIGPAAICSVLNVTERHITDRDQHAIEIGYAKPYWRTMGGLFTASGVPTGFSDRETSFNALSPQLKLQKSNWTPAWRLSGDTTVLFLLTLLLLNAQ